MSFNLIITITFVALVVYIVADTYRRYRVAQGTVWERLLLSARNSATVLWGNFVMAVAALVGIIGDAGDAIGVPQVRDYAQEILGNPKFVAGIMLAISAISVLARKRTLP